MNERQKKFVDYYIQSGNASEAARNAGYSKKTAYSIGERLLRNVEVKDFIDVRLREQESKRVAETKEILEHLTSVLRGEITETIVTPTGKKFTIPVGEGDRLKAANILLKVFGEFREKIDVTVDGAELFVKTLEKVWTQS